MPSILYLRQRACASLAGEALEETMKKDKEKSRIQDK